MKLLLLVLVATFSCHIAAPKPKFIDYSDEFLYWCVPEADRTTWDVHETEPVDCKNVSRGRWDHTPIIVNAEPSLALETIDAIDAFNEALDFPLFTYDPDSLLPDIIALTMGDHPSAAARAKHANIDGRHHGFILVYNGNEDHDRADIIMHELGHLVGLKHDKENEISIMHPSIASRVARLELIDIKALRLIYK